MRVANAEETASALACARLRVNESERERRTGTAGEGKPNELNEVPRRHILLLSPRILHPALKQPIQLLRIAEQDDVPGALLALLCLSLLLVCEASFQL